jgi:hypothetical protein
MHRCEQCGADNARDVGGKQGRLAWLKESYRAAPEERKSALAERIMDLCQEQERYLCEACATCGCCFLTNAFLVDCAICKAPACPNCSLPALRIDQHGKIIEGSDEGSILCSRCNPPTGGHNAGLGLPCPAQPLTVR